jgi:hypothetical protein
VRAAVVGSALVLAVSLLAGCGASSESARTSSTTTTTLAPPPPVATNSAAAAAPLTGLAAERTVLERRALLFKVDNEPGSDPQAGLERADLVYEQMIEGNDTRYAAVFHSQDADVVGPIRSARPFDAVLAKAFGEPVLVLSGAAADILERIRATGVELRVDVDGDPVFRKDRKRPGYHNIMTSTEAVRGSLSSPGAPPAQQWDFSTEPLGGASARDVTVDFVRGKTVAWRYDDATGTYGRQGRSGTLRTESGAPMSFTNLVATEVQPVATGAVDGAGNPTQDWDVLGSGRAWIARGGTMVEGRWSRATPEDRFRIATTEGTPVALSPGTTWWSLVPAGGGVTTR